MKPRNIILPGVLAAALTAAVYLPALENGFVEWDDHVYVYESEGLKLQGFLFLKWALTAVVSSNWHPLTLLTFGAEYRIWGLNPLGYHLTNIVLHAANTFLVYALATGLFGLALGWGEGGKGKGVLAGAFIAALAFGLHPQHVESVAWVSERKDVLSGFFFLASIISYMGYARGEGRRVFLYLLSFAGFALALLSKPMAITLPVVLLILDYYPLGRLGGFGQVKKALVEKIPFFALVPVFAAVTVWAQRGDEAIASLAVSPPIERIDVAVRGFVFYLKKFFVPVDLVPFYVRPLEGEFYDYIFFISLLVFVSISASCIVFRKKRALTAAWLYYVVTLIPVIGIVQVSDMAAADRYSYLPSLGPTLFIAGILAWLTMGRTRRAALLIAFTAPVAAVMVFMTINQISVWKDSTSLWTQEIKVYPTIQAYMKRARAHEKAGRFEAAALDYTVVIGSAEEDMPALFLKRAAAHMNAGNLGAAMRDYDQAVMLDQRNAAAYLGRGAVLMREGDFPGAVRELRRVLELSPGNKGALFKLGIAYSKAGEGEKGLGLIREAARLGLKEAIVYLDSAGIE